MATILQKRLAVNLADAIYNQRSELRGKLLKDILLISGYGLETVKGGIRDILATKGVQEELARIGFDTDIAKARVTEILIGGDDSDSLKAADMVFKTRGSYAPEKHLNLNVELKEILDHANQSGSFKPAEQSSGFDSRTTVDLEQLCKQLPKQGMEA